jgi:hypothetical protein
LKPGMLFAKNIILDFCDQAQRRAQVDSSLVMPFISQVRDAFRKQFSRAQVEQLVDQLTTELLPNQVCLLVVFCSHLDR